MSAPPPPVLPTATTRGSRHCTAIADLTRKDVEHLWARAKVHRAMLDTFAHSERTLNHYIALNCFLEPSTRTRVSFEAGELRLGMHVINLDPAASSLAKGESLTDTRLTLESYVPDVIVVRTAEEGIPQRWAQLASCAIINGGDGTNEHPTQALYDRFTILEAFGSATQPQVLFVGDVAHSRVVTSNVRLAALLGTKVYLAGPPAWVEVATKFADCPQAWEVVELEDFLPKADVVNCLRVQVERGAEESVSQADYIAGWQINRERLARAKPSAILMHPAPVNRGVELASDLVEDPRSWIQRQGGNGQAVRMAVLEWCLGAMP